MSQHSELSLFPFCYGSASDDSSVDSGAHNRVVHCPDISFFAVVSDEGATANSKQAAKHLVSALTGYVKNLSKSVLKLLPGSDGELLKKAVQNISDEIYHSFCSLEAPCKLSFTGVWLVRNYALFVNLGDSRAYFLEKYSRRIRQITFDDYRAQEVFDRSLFDDYEDSCPRSPEEELKRFVGITPPAEADCFFEQVRPGDRILICNKTLYDRIEKPQMVKIMRSSRSVQTICDELILTAKDRTRGGGTCAVCVRVCKDSDSLQTPYGKFFQTH